LILSPPPELPVLGLLFAGGEKCSYFRDDRPARTIYSQPQRVLTPQEYDTALSLGMRRSGQILYRPVCPGCRKCQPFRIAIANFEPSKSQRRVIRKCEGRFEIRLHRPRLDHEHLDLFARYQAGQHGERGIDATEESYEGFLVRSVVDTMELSWRDSAGRLCAVGIVDMIPSGVSTVYFFWDPMLRDLSLGTYSALVEMDLCRQWNKPYYYLGYLVPGAETMNYKASFSGGEIWNGENWVPVGGRGIEEPLLLAALAEAETGSIEADQRRFPILR
jgi:arginyl-tRNA--protein-N-Asp/Glu arginylyltransferase